jgi:hypothetical protein
MNVDDRTPLGVRHLVKDTVPQDPGVVHDAIDAAECLNGGGDHALRTRRVCNAIEVGERLAAGMHNFVGDFSCRARIRQVAGGRYAGIVDEHGSAVSRGEQSNFPSDAAAGAGDHDHFAL